MLKSYNCERDIKIKGAIAMLGNINIRKHILKSHGWGERIPTIVDLTDEELAVLRKHGNSGLDAFLKEKGEFAFPALDIAKPRIIFRDSLLVSEGKPMAAIVCPAGNIFYQEIARRISDIIPDAKLPVISDKAFRFSAHRSKNLIVLGGSHENTASRNLAGCGLCFANRLLPGKGGLLVQTLHGLIYPSQNIVIAAASYSDMLEEVFRSGLTSTGGKWILSGLDRLILGLASAAKIGCPEDLLRNIGKNLSWLPDSRKATIFEDITGCINASFDSGGPTVNRDNGHCTIPNIVRMYYAYRYTGDLRFLEVFRKTLLGLGDYFLNIPGGASYPSDYDFFLGDLIRCWSLAESEPLFSEAERLLITNVLLASVRTIDRYQDTFWPIRSGRLRFNHETFPAMSLYWAARYFDTCYAIPDAKKWKQKAKLCFSGPIDKVFKHTENSNSYQWIVPAHKLLYDLATGKYEALGDGHILRTAWLSAASTDNFGYAVPFGDAEPITGTASQVPLQSAVAELNNDCALAGILKRSLESLGNKPHHLLPCPGWGNLFWPDFDNASPPIAGIWEILQLDDHIRRWYQPTMPKKYVADKIALRSGWNDNDQYLLFCNYSCDSHNHYDMNSIAAYNHQGRMWLVDNGYGKPRNVTNMLDAFRQRERGPRDHNTVIFYDPSGNPIIPPPFAAILTCERADGIFLLESALGNISGALWIRSLVVFLDRFLLVIDRISVRDASGFSRIECQFNALGEDKLEEGMWSLEQHGITLRMQFSGPGKPVTGSYDTQGWAKILETTYPFAKPPIRKLSRIVEMPTNDSSLTFMTLLEAGKVDVPKYRLDDAGVAGEFPENLVLDGVNIHLKTHGRKRLELELNENLHLPGDLSEDCFGPCGNRRQPARNGRYTGGDVTFRRR